MAVREVMESINSVCRSKGGHYREYSCKVVSWDDVSRGTVGGSLSCWGANITDTYLKSKNGTNLFTVRSDNWNEKLGVISADEVAVVAGTGQGPVQPVTLRNVLTGLGHFGSYAGLAPNTNLFDSSLDAKCSIRFQTTFIPVSESSFGPSKLEFATEAYNYNTMDDSDPRNLVLLCTSQGMAVQQDGRGAKKLFHHAVDDMGEIHRYWLEAEESNHKVGGEQRETDAERAEAQARGKATSSVIGIRAMGQRFNVLMTIQVPLQQSPAIPRFGAGMAGAFPMAGALPVPSAACSSFSASPYGFFGAPMTLKAMGATLKQKKCNPSAACTSGGDSLASALSIAEHMPRGVARRARQGQSSAARVSRGTEYDTWPGLSVKAPKRNSTEHVTVTVVLYHAVKGGTPTAEDVLSAIDDLESLYRACAERGRLVGHVFDFMKEPLKFDDMDQISKKVKYQPPVVQVIGHDQFPV